MSFRAHQLVALRIVLAVALVTTATDAWARVAVRYNHQGQFVNVNGFDSSGCTYVYLSVSKGGPTGTEETFLNYYVWDQCTETQIAFGSGRIANSDFVITNRNATLNTTPGSNPVFSFYREGAVGSISLTFTKTGLLSYSWSGHSRWEAGTVAVRTHGSYSSSDASVAGSVIGVQLSSASAEIGGGRDRTIEIEKK